VTSAVVEIETPELGDRSYLVHDGDQALVVDPQRDIDRVLKIAAAVGVRVTHVAETHLHDDYVSGGPQLARETGAAYLVGADEAVAFPRVAVREGDEIAVGDLTVTVLATPGHTAGHVAYVVGSPGAPRYAFTGGSMLHGNVGRSDLCGLEHAERLARAQWRSVRRLATALPDDVAVLPTHGFGSFCAAGPRHATAAGTIAHERSRNPALQGEDEAGFVRRQLGRAVGHPGYYRRLAALNATGVAPIDLPPVRPIGAADLGELLANGTWVVDVRDRAAFARDHLEGSVSFEMADSFAPYLGWVVPWGAEVALIAGAPDRLERARRDLARIGIDHLSGSAAGSLDRVAGDLPRSSYPISDFTGLAKERVERSPLVLDVRREDEWRAGHVEGATHVFVADLPACLAEVPAGQVWVYCASGWRASVAASLLHRAGRDVVLVDDKFANAGPSGLAVVSG
jgi:glyoxylase-like metal-dependent hydrolase (beta-lactamase superfamily II)/rhodanese-related sulfurtransferase